MKQEGAIQGWLESIELKKKEVKEKDLTIDKLQKENEVLEGKLKAKQKRVDKLELDMAQHISRINHGSDEVEELKSELEKA